MINMILCADDNGGIGYKNGLPWPRLSEDLKWFRQLTQHNVVVMGSKTWKSLGVHAPLVSRNNYVISTSKNKADFVGCSGVLDPSKDTIEVILASLELINSDKDIFVIGGKTLYDEAYEFCDAIYLTKVHGTYQTDTKCNLDIYLKGFLMLDSMVCKGDQHTPDITFETHLRPGDDQFWDQQELF
mgnify:CR=1 FL=1